MPRTVKFLISNRVVNQALKLANWVETHLVKGQDKADKLLIVIGVPNLTMRMILNRLVTHLNHIVTKSKKL